jgi:hypothetical protein
LVYQSWVLHDSYLCLSYLLKYPLPFTLFTVCRRAIFNMYNDPLWSFNIAAACRMSLAMWCQCYSQYAFIIQDYPLSWNLCGSVACPKCIQAFSIPIRNLECRARSQDLMPSSNGLLSRNGNSFTILIYIYFYKHQIFK